MRWKEMERDGFDLIEWVKINPIEEVFRGRLVEPKLINHAAFVIEMLEACNIYYEEDEGVFIIYGYKR